MNGTLQPNGFIVFTQAVNVIFTLVVIAIVALPVYGFFDERHQAKMIAKYKREGEGRHRDAR